MQDVMASGKKKDEKLSYDRVCKEGNRIQKKTHQPAPSKLSAAAVLERPPPRPSPLRFSNPSVYVKREIP